MCIKCRLFNKKEIPSACEENIVLEDDIFTTVAR